MLKGFLTTTKSIHSVQLKLKTKFISITLSFLRGYIKYDKKKFHKLEKKNGYTNVLSPYGS